MYGNTDGSGCDFDFFFLLHCITNCRWLNQSVFLIFCGTVQKNVKIEIITVNVTTHDRIFRCKFLTTDLRGSETRFNTHKFPSCSVALFEKRGKLQLAFCWRLKRVTLLLKSVVKNLQRNILSCTVTLVALTPWLWALSLRYTHSCYALWPHWRLWVPQSHNHCLYVRLCLNIAPFIMDSLDCPKTLRNIGSPTLIGAVRCIVCRWVMNQSHTSTVIYQKKIIWEEKVISSTGNIFIPLCLSCDFCVFLGGFFDVYFRILVFLVVVV